MILQRRLASSPAAIHSSLQRRRQRLQGTLDELRESLNSVSVERILDNKGSVLDEEDFEDMEDGTAEEVEESERALLDRATAASTINELKAETETLLRLERLAHDVLQNGGDRKWRELASLLTDKFPPNEKLVIFTEHLDTLNYLSERISALWEKEEAIVCIHGGVRREDRAAIQESFRTDPEVKVLIATDAAGEGINLQQAHLMVNYDLPWNPNRIEQRFGRIHRIGQTEVCHLWNLVAKETREGEVYELLLAKLEEARNALGGKVFDVMGKLHFEGRQLRELLVDAIRYGEQPDVRGRLTKAVDSAFDHDYLKDLWEEKALAHDTMDSSRLHRVRENMERAEGRRLQPHYIRSFFLEAFRLLGGKVVEREPERYSVTHVPAVLRNREKYIPRKYDRIVFDKKLKAQTGQSVADFVCPGHPLLDVTRDVILERHHDLLTEGAVLVDENDPGRSPRALFYLDHSIQDETKTVAGQSRVVSERVLYVEIDSDGNTYHPQYAPYLDYRPLTKDEPGVEAILERPESVWLTDEIEEKVHRYALSRIVPEHLKEVREHKLEHIDKTENAVKERLTQQINHWEHRANDLMAQEQSGKVNAKLNSDEARRRSQELQERLRRRLERLGLERQLSALPPVILGCVLVVPAGLLYEMMGNPSPAGASSVDRQAIAARARRIVMDIERGLGFDPIDRESDKVGYDVESKIPGTGELRFIEVKGRSAGADTLTVTRNEVLYSLNKPQNYILAMVEFFPDGQHQTRYLKQPFQNEPDFDVTSVNYNFGKLIERSEDPK